MTEQLDIFVESAKQEEPQVEEHKSSLTPRQWRLLDLIKHNSLVEHRKTTQKEICDTLKDYGYEWDEDEKSHDHCTMVWTDIKDINLSYETDKLIISKNFEYWIGNNEETQEFLDKLWNDLCPRLIRYWNYKQKVSRDGQGQLLSRKLDAIDENSKARDYIESYGKTRISEY